MSSTYDADIRSHYDKVAASCGTSSDSTMADRIVRDKETKAIHAFVRAALDEIGDGNKQTRVIADVGCGNGYTLRSLAEAISGPRFLGIEYNDALRELAVQQTAAHAAISVSAGDLRDLGSISVDPESIDVLICQRVLINLLNPDDQIKALQNIVDLLRPGAHCLFIEAFASGLNELNMARAEFGLSPIAPAEHNLYLSDSFFEHQALSESPLVGIETRRNFLSTHYYVSRVLHDAVAVGNAGAKLVRNSHFVQFFSAALPDSVGNYSPLQLHILQKMRS
ncbi:MAG: class I SAM-dependent methyltransferase [Pseudorhodoplanes sp.]|nr:class I SAM-dependent methyltransferase [Pseudorhodoplanes sp.]